jgi:hypothetical protein
VMQVDDLRWRQQLREGRARYRCCLAVLNLGLQTGANAVCKHCQSYRPVAVIAVYR